MDIYHYHPVTGIHLGTSQADESPREEGEFLIPAHATESVPPVVSNGQQAVWIDGIWQLEDIPVPPESPAPALEDVRAQAVISIKNEAGSIILASLPQWRQANLTARSVELLADGDTSGAEWLDIRAQWNWVKAVRGASDHGEAAINAALDSTGISQALAAAVTAMETI
ncbi:MAG: hypothetical protein Q8O79_00745 [Pseudomonadota bacterium]|nr:hypothetical protein [Pseudomonadota bacterium]